MSFINAKKENYRSGFVAIIGRPNVGKSTLVNKLVGEKIAITSPVAQTTRNRLRAIITTPEAQLILVDTPGIHKPNHLLGERLVKNARSTIGEVDLILIMLDASYPPGKGDLYIVNLLANQKIPVIPVLNKWDLVLNSDKINRKILYQEILDKFINPIHYSSAFTGEGCDSLLVSLSEKLPLGPQLYPQEMISDQPQKVLIGELIREQVLLNTKEEIPHSVAVSIDRLEEVRNTSKKNNKITTAILATVFVERKSQKAILIGKGGQMLKTIGSAARLQIQILVQGKVYLEIFVKVSPDWRKKPSRLAELGYVCD